MRRMGIALAALAILLPLGASAEDEAADPKLSQAEWQEMIDLLEESRALLMGRISGLTDEQWNFKPKPDRWSVAECVEHIIHAEQGLLGFARQAFETEPDPAWSEKTKGKTDLIRQVMPNRKPFGQGGASAPAEIRPTNNWDRATSIQKFYEARGEVRGLIETISGDVKSHVTEHPFPVFNSLSAHDWLIYIPLHTIRHSRQIIEVQEDENYPKGSNE